MNTVDWELVLSGLEIHVEYSSMTIPDDRICDGTVASIRLPRGYFVDVSWYSDTGYRVGLYRGDFDSPIDEHDFQLPLDAINQVWLIGIALRRAAGAQNRSATCGVSVPVDQSIAADRSSVSSRIITVREPNQSAVLV